LTTTLLEELALFICAFHFPSGFFFATFSSSSSRLFAPFCQFFHTREEFQTVLYQSHRSGVTNRSGSSPLAVKMSPITPRRSARIGQQQQVKVDNPKGQLLVENKECLEEGSSNNSTCAFHEPSEKSKKICSSVPYKCQSALVPAEPSSPSKRRLHSGTIPSPVSALTPISTILMSHVTEEVEVE
jgi:hypothetical protein